MPQVATEYFDSAFDKREKVIGKALGVLKHRKDEYDVIACRGYSGMVIAPTLAFCLKKKLFVVRKDGESCHSRKAYVGDLGNRYLIVDDFIATGKTVIAIQEALRAAHDRADMAMPIIVGAYLYEDYDGKSIQADLKIWSEGLALRSSW